MFQQILTFTTSVHSFFITSFALQFEALILQHAIATPVSVLLSQIDELENVGATEARIKKMRQAIQRLKLLSSQPFIKKSKHGSCSIVWAVGNAVRLLRTCNQQIVMNDFTDKLKRPRVKIAQIEFEESMVCLIKNAIEANRYSNVPIHISLYQESTQCRVVIKDFGVGMSWFIQHCAQFPFISFRQSGRGLGLSYAKMLIEHKLKGKMKIYSELGCGTTIECFIPICQ